MTLHKLDFGEKTKRTALKKCIKKKMTRKTMSF